MKFKLKFNPKVIGVHFETISFKRLWTNYFIDISIREFYMFLPLIIYIIFFGINPFFVIDTYSAIIELTFETNFDLIF